MRRMVFLLSLFFLLVLVPTAAHAGCILNVTCPGYVTPIYELGVQLLMSGYTPIQMVQIGMENVGWIQATYGITEAEAVYAIGQVYAILEPWYVQTHGGSSSGNQDGDSSGPGGDCCGSEGE